MTRDPSPLPIGALRALHARLYHQMLAACFDTHEDWQANAARCSRAGRMAKLVETHQYLKCRWRLP